MAQGNKCVTVNVSVVGSVLTRRNDIFKFSFFRSVNKAKRSVAFHPSFNTQWHENSTKLRIVLLGTECLNCFPDCLCLLCYVRDTA